MKVNNYICGWDLSLLCYDVFKRCGGSVQIYIHRRTVSFNSFLWLECFAGAVCCLAFSLWVWEGGSMNLNKNGLKLISSLDFTFCLALWLLVSLVQLAANFDPCTCARSLSCWYEGNLIFFLWVVFICTFDWKCAGDIQNWAWSYYFFFWQ